MSREWVDRYLALLGVGRSGPGLQALSALVQAHIYTIPFTNVTAILRRLAHPVGPVPAVDPEAQLASWERGRGGGVCFELSEMFSRLLVSVGYRAYPVLAQSSFPGSHQAVLVELDGLRYLAEVANGSPFFEPIPLDRSVEIRRIGLAYRFRAEDTAVGYVQERSIEGAWKPYFRYDLRPVAPLERETAYQRHHRPGASWVMDELRLVRCREAEIYSIRNGRFTHFTAGGKRSEPVSETACIRLAAEVFGMPDLPIARALEVLSKRAPAPIY